MSYTKISEKFIEDINSLVSVYSHDKTKARIMTIKNDDPNKVFSIAFRTPAINNCGLTHILEHSVLCGSKKYPLKDPFVELLKGSMNTFLNAMTFPDKTMYPCASMNDKDYRNLMSVYLDAVFYPNVCQNKYIFKQEGWHYEMKDKESPLTINGVVYNEMKGAYSDPLSVISRYIMHSLYKDNSYTYESGGDPKEIPNLSYEDFTKFYHDYYSPSNSYIFLYGNSNMEDDMKFIEDEYLNNFSYNNFDTTIKDSLNNEMVYEEYYYNSDSDDDLPFYSYNVSTSDFKNFKDNIALTVVVDVLFNVRGAKIQERLLKEGIAKNIDASFDTELKQPIFSVVCSEANPDKKERFKEILEEEFQNVSLDYDRIIAQLKYLEFKIREAKNGSYPRGLLYEMNALESWLYDDNMPFESLESLKYIKELLCENEDYYNNLVKKYIVLNPHKSFVSLLPKKGLLDEEERELENKLKAYKASLTDSEIDNIINDFKELQRYQNEKDSEEVIKTLPHLTIEDLDVEPQFFNIEKISNIEFEGYYSNYFTNKIVYSDYHFDITDFAVSDLQYIKLLTNILCSVSTKYNTYSELDKLIKLHSGGCGFSTNLIIKDNGCYKLFLDLSISSLDNEYEYNQNLMKEVMFDSVFDKERVYQLLNIFKSNLQNVSDIGHLVAYKRASSYLNEASYISEMISGISYSDFISDLVLNFDDIYESLTIKFKELINKIFVKKRFSFNMTSDIICRDNVVDSVSKFYNNLEEGFVKEKEKIEIKRLNEAILTPYDANYMARCGIMETEYSGSLKVLEKAISLDYLWQKVRVLGGAYGCMIKISRDKTINLVSYRDPNSIRTDNVYKDLYKFVLELNPSEDDLLKYKIGCMGYSDLHAQSKGRIAFQTLISGIGYEDLKKIRLDIINTTKEDLNKYSNIIKKALDDSVICGLVSKKGLEESSELYSNIRNLKK